MRSSARERFCWCATQYTLDGQEALAHAVPRHMLQLEETFHCGVLLTLILSAL